MNEKRSKAKLHFSYQYDKNKNAVEKSYLEETLLLVNSFSFLTLLCCCYLLQYRLVVLFQLGVPLSHPVIVVVYVKCLIFVVLCAYKDTTSLDLCVILFIVSFSIGNQLEIVVLHPLFLFQSTCLFEIHYSRLTFVHTNQVSCACVQFWIVK